MAYDVDALGQSLSVSSVVLETGAVFVPETLTPVETVSITNANHDDEYTGVHWHANALGTSPGIPLERAEVGSIIDFDTNTGTCRGLAEWLLGGKAQATTATLKLKVRNVGLGGDEVNDIQICGLFTQDTSYEGNINIVVYSGDGSLTLGDFTASATGTVTNAFDTTGAIIDQEFQVDITTHYNALIAAAATAIGIKVQANPEPSPDDHAITFYDLRITVA